MALTIDDILAFRSVSDVQLSPDGAQFAFVVSANHTTLDKADDGELRRCTGSAIWLCGAQPGSEARQLTFGPALGSDSLPRWSPDGATLAFLSDRADVGGQRQIYTMPVPRGGGGSDDDGAQAVTDVQGDIPTPRGLNAVQWDPDGASIAFLLEETIEGQGERALGDDAIEYEAHEQFVRVNRLDLATSRVAPISPRAAGQIWEFAPGPGGKIAAVVSEAPFEWSWYGCRLVAFDGTEDAAVQLWCWSGGPIHSARPARASCTCYEYVGAPAPPASKPESGGSEPRAPGGPGRWCRERSSQNQRFHGKNGIF